MELLPRIVPKNLAEPLAGYKGKPCSIIVLPKVPTVVSLAVDAVSKVVVMVILFVLLL